MAVGDTVGMPAPPRPPPDAHEVAAELRRQVESLARSRIIVPVTVGDPLDPVDGQLWIRSDTNELRWPRGGLLDAWTTPALVNSWAHGNPVLRYRRSGAQVWLQGVVGGGSETGPTTIFTLPAGLRPTADLTMSVATYNADATAHAAGAIKVQASGAVVFVAGFASAVHVTFSFFVA